MNTNGSVGHPRYRPKVIPMSISGVSSAAGAYQPAAHPSNKQIRKDFADLSNALQIGDLSRAQNAFLALQQSARHAQGEKTPGAVQNQQQNLSVTAPAASPDAVASTNPGASGATHNIVDLRQQLFGVKPPVPTDAPDADGRTGSYRRLVTGIDPTIPGNPGYADYHGLGGTAATIEQIARNSGMNMGGSLANRAGGQVMSDTATAGNSTSSGVNTRA